MRKRPAVLTGQRGVPQGDSGAESALGRGRVPGAALAVGVARSVTVMVTAATMAVAVARAMGLGAGHGEVLADLHGHLPCCGGGRRLPGGGRGAPAHPPSA